MGKGSVLGVGLAVVGLVLWAALSALQPKDDAGGESSGVAAESAEAVRQAPLETMSLPEALEGEVAESLLSVPLQEHAAESGQPTLVKMFAVQKLPNGGRGPAAVAELELGVSWSRKDYGEALHTLQTDSSGQAQMELSWEHLRPAADGSRPWIWLRSSGPGLLTRTDSRRVPKEAGAAVQLSVDIQAGTTMEGRILGPDGEGVAGQVQLMSYGPDGGLSSTMAKAAADGLFSGELRQEAETFLYAEATSDPDGKETYRIPSQLDLGTGVSENFQVSFTSPVPFQEVHVSGPGLIHGRLTDADDQPAVGVRLQALVVPSGIDDGSTQEESQVALYAMRLEGGGHLGVSATTDTEGAFEFRGLRNAFFFVYALSEESFSGRPTTLLTPEPIPSHGEPLHLRLSRPHLALHVRHADGSVPGPGFTTHRFSRLYDTLDEWPEQSGLIVSLAPEDAHTREWRGPYLEPKQVGPGEFVLDVDAELSVDIGVIGGGAPWRPQRVTLPPGAGRVDVDVVLAEEVRTAALVLGVVDSAGEPLVEQVRVRLSDPATGVVLYDKGCDYTDEGDWPLRVELPEGEYRLLVEGHAWIEDHHGTLMEQREHGAFEQDILLSSAGDLAVTARLGAGARLDLKIVGAASAEEQKLLEEKRDGFVSFGDSKPPEAPSVSLRLEREGRWPEYPSFRRFAMGGTSAAGTHMFSSLLLGSEGVSEILTPGEYTLVATIAGGRSLERKVVLAPGQTLQVLLNFD